MAIYQILKKILATAKTKKVNKQWKRQVLQMSRNTEKLRFFVVFNLNFSTLFILN